MATPPPARSSRNARTNSSSRTRARTRTGQAGIAARSTRQGSARIHRCVRRCARPQCDHRGELRRPRRGAVARRCGRRGHDRADRRPAGEGRGQGDHRTAGAARRARSRDGVAPRRVRPVADLRARRAQAARTCGCSSASTASARPPRSASSRTSRSETADGADGRGRHVPCCGCRAADDVGRAVGRRDRARRRGKRSECGDLRRRRAGSGSQHRAGHGRHRWAVCTPSRT